MPDRIFAFTGQGSFKPGFGRQLLGDPIFRDRFQEVCSAAGEDLSERAWGRTAVLTSRDGAALQLTHFALAWAVAHAVAGRTGVPVFCCGHSLGEICALVFSGALDLRAGTRLVRLRGACMEEARKGHPQDMLVAGTGDEARLEALIREGGQGRIFICNLNSSSQILVSGRAHDLAEFARGLDREGIASQALGAGTAFHSPLMAEASERLAPEIRSLDIQPPRLGFFCVEADRLLADPREIRQRLLSHMLARVEWRRAMATIHGLSKDLDRPAICEIGPAKVLRNLRARDAVPGDPPFDHCLDILA